MKIYYGIVVGDKYCYRCHNRKYCRTENQYIVWRKPNEEAEQRNCKHYCEEQKYNGAEPTKYDGCIKIEYK